MFKTEAGKYVDEVICDTLGWERVGDPADSCGDQEFKCACNMCEVVGDYVGECECDHHEICGGCGRRQKSQMVYWKEMPEYQCDAQFTYCEDTNTVEDAKVIYDVSGERAGGGRAIDCGENFVAAYEELNQALVLLAGVGCNVVDGKDNDERVRGEMCAGCKEKRICWDENTGSTLYCEEFMTAVMKADEQDRENAGGGWMVGRDEAHRKKWGRKRDGHDVVLGSEEAQDIIYAWSDEGRAAAERAKAAERKKEKDEDEEGQE